MAKEHGSVGLCDPNDEAMLDWLAERCFSPGDHPDDGILVVVSSEFSPWGEFAIGKEKEALRRAIKRAMIGKINERNSKPDIFEATYEAA